MKCESVFIRRLNNGYAVRAGLVNEWYCPNLRAAIRRAAEELAKDEPATERVSDEELERIIHKPAPASPEPERILQAFPFQSSVVTASFIAELSYIRRLPPSWPDLKKLVRDAVTELHGRIPRATMAEIFHLVQEKLEERQTSPIRRS